MSTIASKIIVLAESIYVEPEFTGNPESYQDDAEWRKDCNTAYRNSLIKALENVEYETTYPMGTDSFDATENLIFSDDSCIYIGNPRGAAYETYFYEVVETGSQIGI